MSDTTSRTQRYILVMSDGEHYTPNYTTDIPEIAAAEAAAAGISIHTLLIGPENASAQLQRISSIGNGRFYGQSLSRTQLLETFQQLLDQFAFSLVQ